MTGDEFSNFYHKKLLSATDFRDRTLGYMRSQIQNVIRLLCPLSGGGFFGGKLAIEADGANQIMITGDFIGTDGDGHLLDISKSIRSVPFENDNGVHYHVGLFYSEAPSGIELDAKTGQPFYRSWVETIGYSDEPDTVIDNEDGTITFECNTLSHESNFVVSLAGKSVLVYKKVPAIGAITDEIAIEICTMQFSNDTNFITTTGNLGQTEISTEASDYMLVELGPTVRHPLQLDMGSFKCAFIGLTTGNGGTPSAFDTSGQRELLNLIPE